MILKDGFPVKFNNTNDPCDSFDQREYCQMVEQNDEINFAWQGDVIGNNLVGCCFDFESSSCAQGEVCEGSHEGGSSYYWKSHGAGYNYGGYVNDDASEFSIICFGDEDTLAVAADYISQTVIDHAGTYKVIVIIPAYPTSNNYQGSFTVQLGDVVSAVTPVAAGTYEFYLSPTSGTDVKIIPDNAVMCLDSVEVYEVCSDYSLNVFDKNGTFVKNITENITNYNDQFFYKSTWDDMGLSDGCYYLCIVKECLDNNAELITNGDFSASSGWVFGTGWAYDGVNDEADHTGANHSALTHAAVIKANTNYVITFRIKNYSSGDITVYLGTSSDYLIAYEAANGLYTVSFRTGASVPAQKISFYPGLGENPTTVLSIDDVSVSEAETACSTCYDLKDNHPCTKLIAFTNDDDGFGIPYSSVVFVSSLRVFAFIEKPRYPQEADRFAFSDGTRKILYASGEKIWTLFLDYLPEYLHDAIANAKIHDHFYIDSIEYICTSDEYIPEWRNRLKLAQGKIEIQRVIDNNKNKNC